MARADWLSVVEAAYAPARDDAAWGDRVLESMRPILDNSHASGFHAITHSADCSSIRTEFASGDFKAADVSHAVSGLGFEGVRAFYYPKHLVGTAAEVLRELGDATTRYWKGYLGAAQIDDALAMITEPDAGVPLVLWAGFTKQYALPREKRARLTQIALHLETGYRLRRRPEIVKAVVSADGKLLHREEDAPNGDLLAARVKRIERARTKRTRFALDALDLWEALVAGRASFVERTEGTRRHYLVVENPPARTIFRSFTQGELDVVSCAARGLATKQIGYALGLSSPVVSARLASAAGKIGLASRMELVRLAAMFTRDPRARFEDDALTDAEREVLTLLRDGLSNKAIAELRGRSVRTIANQVAQLLRKTKSSSRRALVVRS